MPLKGLPFQEQWRGAMLSGRKTLTSRIERSGIRPGDTFEAFGITFRVGGVFRSTVGSVARAYWRMEGCHSPDEYLEVWRRLHPKRNSPTQPVWAISFYRTPRGGPNSQSPIQRMMDLAGCSLCGARIANLTAAMEHVKECPADDGLPPYQGDVVITEWRAWFIHSTRRQQEAR